MSKKYWRYQALGSGSIVKDGDWAFEIRGRSVVTHRVETSGFFRKKTHFEAVGEIELRPGLEVDLWAEDSATGSGNCDLKSGRELVHEYHVFGEAAAFAEALRAAIP